MQTKLLQLAYHDIISASELRRKRKVLVVSPLGRDINANAAALTPAGSALPVLPDIGDVAKRDITGGETDSICRASDDGVMERIVAGDP